MSQLTETRQLNKQMVSCAYLVLFWFSTRHRKNQEVKILSFGMIVKIKYIMRVTKKQTHTESQILDRYMPLRKSVTRLATYFCDGLKENV